MYNSQNPIDIHCAKLLDWLVQHRHCKKDWGQNLASIRRKIKTAIKDMPESDQIRELLLGSKLDYFKSKQIIDVLKTTEADSKNIFGYYSSQRMKDWQSIVQSYEKDYIFLAELATDLNRLTSYEVPAVRRTIQRLHKEKSDAEKERADLLRRSQQFRSDHARLAQTYGIKGVNVVAELQEQTNNLSKFISEITELSAGLKEGLEFYRERTASNTKLETSSFLSTLKHVIDRGNTTVYELKHNECPDTIERDDKPPGSSLSSGNASEVDLINDEIDFGDDVPSSSESSSGFVHLDSTTEVTLVDENRIESESKDKVARGDDARTILEFRKTRNRFINDIYELEAFYRQLSYEDQTESEKRFDKKDVQGILTIIREILDVFEKDKSRILFQMNDSPNLIESINQKFSERSKKSSESSMKAEQIQDKIRLIEEQIKENEIVLKKIIFAAKELQSRVENSISELYKGRPINIMGCVN